MKVLIAAPPDAWWMLRVGVWRWDSLNAHPKFPDGSTDMATSREIGEGGKIPSGRWQGSSLTISQVRGPHKLLR